MLNEETRRKLRLLNIGEFVEELEIQQQDPQTLALPFDDRFQMLADSVYQRKYNDKVQRLIKNARLRLPKADCRLPAQTATCAIFGGHSVT